MRTTLVLMCCAALAVTACSSGSAEVDESGDGPPASPAPPAPTPPAPPTPPPPSPPAPPPPSPPPAPGNEPPRADAGSDKSTVEEQDVTIDGSGSRDPENDPLTLSWSLVSAPEGSQLTLSATGATITFRPDVPGNYELQLTASDGRGIDTDTVRVRAEALVRFNEGGSFRVERRGGDDDDDEKHRRPVELQLRTSELYRGSNVPFTVSTDARWLRAVEPAGITAPRGDETELHAVLVMSEVDRLPNGKYEAHLIVTPEGGWEAAEAAVTLEIKGNGSGEVAPYVSYAGEASFVTVYGSGLNTANGARVFVDDHDVGVLTVTADTQGTITLPALDVGEHTLRVGADGEALRLVVRDRPTHSAIDLALPGTAISLEYDAERDAFYGVFVASDGTRSALRLQNSGTGVWVADVIALDTPRDVALTADGVDLLVATDACAVHRLDPQTLALRESFADANCTDATTFGALVKLVDGQPVAIEESGDPTLWAFPEGSRTYVPLPNTATFEFADGALHVRVLR